MIALDRPKVIRKPPMIFHGPGHAVRDPGGEFESLHQFRLVPVLARRHLPERHLLPDAFPQTDILRRDFVESLEGNPAFLIVIAMAGQTVLLEKRPGDLFDTVVGLGPRLQPVRVGLLLGPGRAILSRQFGEGTCRRAKERRKNENSQRKGDNRCQDFAWRHVNPQSGPP